MSDMLQTAVAFALGRIQTHCSQTVSYETENGTVTDILATLGETELEEMGGNAVVQSRRRDYIFKAADLSIGGQTFKPKEGDVVVEGNLRSKVVPLTADDACWHTEDPFNLIIRVHTVVVKDSTP